MGHVNGRTAQTDTNVKAHHMAEQARQQAVKHLLETAERIRNMRSGETFKIARDLENSAYTLNDPTYTPTEEPTPPIGQLVGLSIISAIGVMLGVLLIKRGFKKE